VGSNSQRDKAIRSIPGEDLVLQLQLRALCTGLIVTTPWFMSGWCTKPYCSGVRVWVNFMHPTKRQVGTGLVVTMPGFM
jgi:hypothetical protein